MPDYVRCPTCQEELDIPAEFRSRPVRCAACNTLFTPSDAATAPVATRVRPGDEPRDDPRRDDDYDDDRDLAPRPRRRDRDFRPPPRRSNTWVWLLLLGLFGVCGLGCCGFGYFAVQLVQPTLTPYQAPDGRFEASFPGPVAVSTLPQAGAGVAGTATVYEHRRKFFGAVFDTYFVRVVDLRGNPSARERDRALEKIAEELAAGGTLVRRSKSNLGVHDGLEVFIAFPASGQPENLLAKLAVVGDKIVVMGVRGQSLETPAEQERVGQFWDTFSSRAADKPGRADPPGFDDFNPDE